MTDAPDAAAPSAYTGVETYSYLGPAGTFTEAALRLAPQAQGKPWKPVNNVNEALADVTSGRSVAAMIAIENSIEGGVTASQDALATTPGLRIIGEYTVPISFSLAVRPGVALEDVKTIAAHPVAYGQCRAWLTTHLPGHTHLPATSNIASAGSLFDEGLRVDAAITPPNIRERIQVDVLAEGIEDNKTARTRFALVSMTTTLPPRTGADKTSLIVELPEDRPGSLVQMLEQFATRGVNMSVITSRPIPERIGRYRFVIDLEGHLHDARVADALRGLRRYSPHVIFLGSYPEADGTPVQVEGNDTDEHYAEAEAWLASLERDPDGLG
ncbi:prephenate dehydratase [Pseudoclavibacter chungangensis]|uniref:Prephenate dehydratase n=1 Tax=Pseudoclavibacter chungangensis TaxID=587635 RepID=A0A7J5BQX6_9MICO|nr:prephenate dehydratase [Pseudoclavibacter chungangensis]KAB1653844.1 prephenate dehydratase [Pseudoclavibacter chungangensis]NYJ68144.1 prephenate dehydratase [Pseudoclavibacter chungangensis]